MDCKTCYEKNGGVDLRRSVVDRSIRMVYL